MSQGKTIALIAHDHMKDTMVEWCKDNREALARHVLCGTGHTAVLVQEATGLPVKAYKSGPMGGDLQIAAEMTNGHIDAVIFFSDPLTAQPHDPDVKALLRIAQVCDIPLANNRATAECVIHSDLL